MCVCQGFHGGVVVILSLHPQLADGGPTPHTSMPTHLLDRQLANPSSHFTPRCPMPAVGPCAPAHTSSNFESQPPISRQTPHAQDEGLRLQLLRQEFVEALRSGSAAGRAAALEIARTRLAPAALHASSPDAYADFRTALLAMVAQPAVGGVGEQAGGISSSPTASPPPDERPPAIGPSSPFSPVARSRLAGLLARSLRTSLGLHPPRLVITLRYLALAQRASAARGPLVRAELAALAGGPRDDRGAPPAAAGVTAPAASGSQASQSERHVQALRHALLLPREAAAAALRCAAGRGLGGALLDELGALRGGDGLVREWAVEYAVLW